MLFKGNKVPRPSDCPEFQSGRVFQYYIKAEDGKRHRRLIGKVPCLDPDFKREDYTAADGTALMIPNDNYFKYYKDQFANYLAGGIPEDEPRLPPCAIKVGLYALVLGVVLKLGIYDILCQIFKPIFANAILDLAMFYILTRECDLNVLNEKMNEQLTFSIVPRSQSWYSAFLNSYKPIDSDAKTFIGELLSKMKNEIQEVENDETNEQEDSGKEERDVEDELSKGGLDDKAIKELFLRYSKKEPAISQNKIYEYMRRWVKLRIENGSELAVISIDGTNMDCQSKENDKAKKGAAKTKKEVPIVNVMSTVEAAGRNRGMPLAYYIAPGNRPDVITSQAVLTFFKEMGLKLKSLLADRGFCYEAFMALCEELKMPFLAMMKENYLGSKTMYKLYHTEIFWNKEYWIQGRTNTFGISQNDVTLFSKESENPYRTGCVAIFFNGNNYTRSNRNYQELVNIEIRRLEYEIEETKRNGTFDHILAQFFESTCLSNPSEDNKKIAKITEKEFVLAALTANKIEVAEEYRDVLELNYNEETKHISVTIKFSKFETKCDHSGYSYMVSSVPKTAQEMSDEYQLRDSSEKSFSATKSELGFSTLEVSGDERFESKYFTCYIADIIRNEIISCFHRYEEEKKKHVDTNQMIQSFASLEFIYTGSGYEYAGQSSEAHRIILGYLGITVDNVKQLSPLVNARAGITSMFHLRRIKHGIPSIPKAGKPGRPSGSKSEGKNNDNEESATGASTDRAEEEKNISTNSEPNNTDNLSHTNDSNSEQPSEPITPKKSHGGRKKGSKNKSTLQREAEEAAKRERRIAEGLPPEEPKQRGRKPGSKNKKTIEREKKEAAERERRIAEGLPPEEPKPVRHGGRPKGAKNKKTLLREAEEQARREAGELPPIPQTQEKNSRKGSQYKTTLLQDEYDRKLSEETGIDIIGNPPPRPWDRATRQSESRRRAKLRKIAEARRRTLRAAAIPDPVQ